jgi:co-chaperonin GroES (HSP10)
MKLIQAVHDKIVVQDLKRTKSTGGLILPDNVQDPQKYGRVISIGEKVEGPFEIGQIIVYHNNGGMSMVIEGKVLRCLVEKEIYGILENEELVEALETCEVKQKDLDEIQKVITSTKDQASGGSRIVRV